MKYDPSIYREVYTSRHCFNVPLDWKSQQRHCDNLKSRRCNVILNINLVFIFVSVLHPPILDTISNGYATYSCNYTKYVVKIK